MKGNDFDKILKNFHILYYGNIEFSDVKFFKIYFTNDYFKFFKTHKFTSKIH